MKEVLILGRKPCFVASQETVCLRDFRFADFSILIIHFYYFSSLAEKSKNSKQNVISWLLIFLFVSFASFCYKPYESRKIWKSKKKIIIEN